MNTFFIHHADFAPLQQLLARHGITLQIELKSVKNVNFRLKPQVLIVSAPKQIPPAVLFSAIADRVDWAINRHQSLIASKTLAYTPNPSANQVFLWGKPVSDPNLRHEANRLARYRRELWQVLPYLLDKWQPIVGKYANQVRLKKMHTRWGSCNVAAKRIWLSVYLPAYPLECCEYVLVHELCHLHYADHGDGFWQCVQSAMPDYQKWHDLLNGAD